MVIVNQKHNVLVKQAKTMAEILNGGKRNCTPSVKLN
jgi:hypothetical protein